MQPKSLTKTQSRLLELAYGATFALTAIGEFYLLSLSWGMLTTALEPDPQVSQYAGLMFVLLVIIAVPTAIVGALNVVSASKILALPSVAGDHTRLIVKTSLGILAVGALAIGGLVVAAIVAPDLKTFLS